MSAARHVIFGTGAIGLATLDALRRRAESVRLVNRSGHARVPDDVDVIGGDARDPAFTTAVAHGAAVVYQTLNPPYPEWTAQFPALQDGVLAAAEATRERRRGLDGIRRGGQQLAQGSPLRAGVRPGLVCVRDVVGAIQHGPRDRLQGDMAALEGDERRAEAWMGVAATAAARVERAGLLGARDGAVRPRDLLADRPGLGQPPVGGAARPRPLLVRVTEVLYPEPNTAEFYRKLRPGVFRLKD